MPVSNVLSNFRKGGYGSQDSPPAPDAADSVGGPRQIELTDEEAKAMEPVEPGAEMSVLVTGKLDGSSFTVMSVQPAGDNSPDVNDMAAQVMGKAPMMQNQTMPSPS